MRLKIIFTNIPGGCPQTEMSNQTWSDFLSTGNSPRSAMWLSMSGLWKGAGHKREAEGMPRDAGGTVWTQTRESRRRDLWATPKKTSGRWAHEILGCIPTICWVLSSIKSTVKREFISCSPDSLHSPYPISATEQPRPPTPIRKDPTGDRKCLGLHFHWGSILETRYSWFSACCRHRCCIGLDFWQQAGLHCSAKEVVYKIWERVGMTKAARYECDTSLHTHSLTGILFLLSGKRPISLIGCPSKLVYQLGHLQF